MILGIDVSKATFDVCLRGRQTQQRYRRFANTTKGIEQLVQWLQKAQVSQLHVCLEATNVYWEAVAERLYAVGYKVSVVNPIRVHGFARSQLVRNKTDKQDSKVIAAYCAALDPKPWLPPSEWQRKLRALDRHRQSLGKTLVQQKNRQATSRDADVTQSLQTVIDQLQNEIKRIDEQIEALTQEHEQMRREYALLTSITGIGAKTAQGVMAEMYDLAAYASARAAAADAGLTPAHHESGSSVRKRPRLSKVGKASIRSRLFLPALNAMRTNPVLRALADRLRRRNKPKMVIVAAVMRKLLHIAYGVLKHQTPFDPNYEMSRSTT